MRILNLEQGRPDRLTARRLLLCRQHSRGDLLAELCRQALTKNWELTRDPDYARGNSGITIVLLRK